MNEQFAAPSGESDFVSAASLQGHLAIFSPTQFEEGLTTSKSKQPGDAIAITTDVVDLDGEGGPVAHTDVMFFGKVLARDLKGRIGKKVLARIGQGTSKNGNNPPWVLIDATGSPEDVARAQAYYSELTRKQYSPPAEVGGTPFTGGRPVGGAPASAPAWSAPLTPGTQESEAARVMASLSAEQRAALAGLK